MILWTIPGTVCPAIIFGGVRTVLLAKSMPIEFLRWLVIVVVSSAAIVMLSTAAMDFLQGETDLQP